MSIPTKIKIEGVGHVEEATLMWILFVAGVLFWGSPDLYDLICNALIAVAKSP